MNPTSHIQPQMPDARGVILRVLIALVIGALLTVCVILPAEYRIDPTGIGKAVGLFDLTTPRVVQTSPEPKAEPAKAEPAPAEAPKEVSKVDEKGNPIPVLVKVGPQILRSYPDTFKSEDHQNHTQARRGTRVQSPHEKPARRCCIAGRPIKATSITTSTVSQPTPRNPKATWKSRKPTTPTEPWSPPSKAFTAGSG